MDFQQSQTYKNLLASYEAKLQTSTYYSICSDRAAMENYIEISNLFTTTTRNEKEHARIFLRRINNGQLPSTVDNLNASLNLGSESAELYRKYAQVANEEGYSDIAALFNGIANIELNHNLQFRTQYTNLLNDQVFCKPVNTLWICMQCGNIMSGNCAPNVCPICGLPQGYYRVYANA